MAFNATQALQDMIKHVSDLVSDPEVTGDADYAGLDDYLRLCLYHTIKLGLTRSAGMQKAVAESVQPGDMVACSTDHAVKAITSFMSEREDWEVIKNTVTVMEMGNNFFCHTASNVSYLKLRKAKRMLLVGLTVNSIYNHKDVIKYFAHRNKAIQLIAFIG